MGEYILNAEAIHQATATNNVLFFLESRVARQFMPSDNEISAAEELLAVLEIFHTAKEEE